MTPPEDDFWGITGAVLKRLDAQERGDKEKPARPKAAPSGPQEKSAPTLSEVKRSKEVASLQKLALLYYQQKQYDKAERLYQEAIVAVAEAVGPRNPEVARLLNNLARLYCDQNRHAEAGPLYQRSLVIVEEQFGKEHPKVARRLAGLAEVCFAVGKHSEGDAMYLRALQIEQSALGPRHPDTTETMKAYAAALRKLNRLTDAAAIEAWVQDLRQGHRRRPQERRTRGRRYIAGISMAPEKRQRNDRRQAKGRRSSPGRRTSDQPKPPR